MAEDLNIYRVGDLVAALNELEIKIGIVKRALDSIPEEAKQQEVSVDDISEFDAQRVRRFVRGC